MKEYNVLRNEYFSSPNGDLAIDNGLLNEMFTFSPEEFTTFLTMIHLKCTNKKVNIENISDRIGKNPKDTEKYINKLIETKYIEEV